MSDAAGNLIQQSVGVHLLLGTFLLQSGGGLRQASEHGFNSRFCFLVEENEMLDFLSGKFEMHLMLQDSHRMLLQLFLLLLRCGLFQKENLGVDGQVGFW